MEKKKKKASYQGNTQNILISNIAGIMLPMMGG
jgi:hypothetical protein